MRFLAVILGLALPLFATAEAAPAKATYQEGKQYTVISGQPKPPKTGKIEVTELFWYGCGHCYNFEPVLEKWETTLGSDVKLVRSPAMWKQRANPADAMWTHARLYYTAQAMGALKKLHMPFFEAMHKNNKMLLDKAEIASVVNANGVDGDVFVKTMDSFGVNSQIEAADKRQKAYRITGTPEMVVGGYYHVSASRAGTQEEMLKVVEFLVDKIRSER